MTYLPGLRPSRGLVIEKLQPVTRQDIALVRQVLERHDEAIICVGSAEKSHEPSYVMTAGERIELTDAALQAEGIDSNRYVILPIEDAPDATQWVADIMMTTPRWDTLYTRNYKNAAMFATFQRQHGFSIERIEEQKPALDYFALIASRALDMRMVIPEAALEGMTRIGIDARVDAIYNRRSIDTQRPTPGSRILFLGGLQPFTGDYADRTGHIGAVRQALLHRPQAVIAVGSAQQSYSESDPLTAGKRIEIIRHALLSNGVPGSAFYTVPIKDIAANACFATKVLGMCPSFDAAIAGNDWTKQLFGETRCEIIPIERSAIGGTDRSLSATYVRKTAMEMLKRAHGKDDEISSATLDGIDDAIGRALDPATKAMLREVGFYDTLHFLAHAKE